MNKHIFLSIFAIGSFFFHGAHAASAAADPAPAAHSTELIKICDIDDYELYVQLGRAVGAVPADETIKIIMKGDVPATISTNQRLIVQTSFPSLLFMKDDPNNSLFITRIFSTSGTTPSTSIVIFRYEEIVKMILDLQLKLSDSEIRAHLHDPSLDDTTSSKELFKNEYLIPFMLIGSQKERADLNTLPDLFPIEILNNGLQFFYRVKDAKEKHEENLGEFTCTFYKQKMSLGFPGGSYWSKRVRFLVKNNKNREPIERAEAFSKLFNFLKPKTTKVLK